MQLFTRFPYWRTVLRMSCVIPLLMIALYMEVSGLHFIYAAGGSANFSLQPASSDSNDPLTQSYFIFHTRPAKFVSGSVRVTNTGTARGSVVLYSTDGTTSPSGGLSYLQTNQPLHDVGSWVALSIGSLTLGPGQSKNVSFGLFVPRGVTSGQHVGGIVAESTSPQNTTSPAKGNIKINLSMKKLYALPIVVDIPGSIHEQLSSSGITLDSASPYQRILIGLANTGNVIIYPKGSATITNSRGNVVQTTNLNLNAFLPATSIAYPLNIVKKALPIGNYDVSLVLKYGKNTAITLSDTYSLRVRNTGKSLATLSSQVAIQGPTDFFHSLALWQYALAGVASLLVGSALFFWVQRVYMMVVSNQHKARRS